jgi:hypothetical protein
MIGEDGRVVEQKKGKSFFLMSPIARSRIKMFGSRDIFSNDQRELGCSVSLISRLSDRGCLDDMDETRRLAGRWPSRRAAEGDESSCDQSPARTSQYLESRASLRSPKGSWVIGSPLFPGFLVEDVSTARVRIRTLGAGSSTASSWLSGDIFLLA